ncbi:uncharacterized protein PV09_05317 [Verruconis gallopava]|uniref:Endoplasmic reticulum-Golgi intermediate compartment protein n=1 Tax=Verruconis gallopava TaxID=253628 RepID=A0A0D1YSH5_9PEZI|nr:uncharacterized protein PV09_05317 [Verruconis gallopava]KIW03557.1 hypothetical protein PV09_05317 [Verruconis gallopava]
MDGSYALPNGGYTQQMNTNGWANHNLDEDNFAEPKGVSMRSFDAFPKVKPSFTVKGSHTGSAWTLLLIVATISLLISETRRYFAGNVTHSFTVEKGISHQLQINLDMIVAMRCPDIHVNIQDAAGDRILAADMLQLDPTTWRQWDKIAGDRLKNTIDDDAYGAGADEDVHDYLGAANSRKKFKKTPKVIGTDNACRIYGSIEGNKVQGDFHITARGHGYMEFGMHLSHDQFNFSHIINHLSFGPHYPLLTNPLSKTRTTTDKNFYKFQYYTSIVPTIYTTNPSTLTLSPPEHIVDPSSNSYTPATSMWNRDTIWTNQYAVTEQSHAVNEMNVPGVFFKYDIEPILLLVSEERGSFMSFLARLVNVVSGVLVAGSWCFTFSDWAVETWLVKKGRERLGFLGHGRGGEKFV